jgi:hypothetical protein
MNDINLVYRKYKDKVNMSYSELNKWKNTEASKRASLSRAPINRNLRLLSKNKNEWTNRDIRDANRTISFVSRMSNARQGKKLPVGYSKRDISLKNWAYDPNKR